jgi:hypothetical protein
LYALCMLYALCICFVLSSIFSVLEMNGLHIYTYKHIHTYTYMHKHIHMYTYIHTYIYIHIYRTYMDILIRMPLMRVDTSLRHGNSNSVYRSFASLVYPPKQKNGDKILSTGESFFFTVAMYWVCIDALIIYY